MPGLDLQVATYYLNIKPDAKPVNNNCDGSDLILWRQLKLRFRNSSNVDSFERNSTQTGLLILYPSLKRTKRSGSVLTFMILI